MKRKPFFKTGDDITFEVSPAKNTPRWQLNIDKGYTGEFAEGIILSIDRTCISTYAIYPFDGKGREDSFPNTLSTDYEPEQWWYPGYLRHTKIVIPDCDCGCGNNAGYHWNFCKLGKYQDANR